MVRAWEGLPERRADVRPGRPADEGQPSTAPQSLTDKTRTRWQYAPTSNSRLPSLLPHLLPRAARVLQVCCWSVLQVAGVWGYTEATTPPNDNDGTEPAKAGQGEGQGGEDARSLRTNRSGRRGARGTSLPEVRKVESKGSAVGPSTRTLHPQKVRFFLSFPLPVSFPHSHRAHWSNDGFFFVLKYLLSTHKCTVMRNTEMTGI